MYTPEQVEDLVKERLAEAKAEQDKAFEQLWKEAKDAKALARKLSDLGDPDEIRSRLARMEELESEAKAQKAGITSDQLNKMRAEIRQDLEKEYGKWKQDAESYASQLRELRLNSVVKGAMAKSGVRADRIDALWRLSQDQFDLTEDGAPMLRDRPGTELEKYIAAELSQSYPEFFEGTGSSGGGASRSSGGAAGGSKSVAADDASAFLANLEGIATGKVEVR